jgi:hypothetical protein
MQDFGYINGEFINLYSKENPILETNDICYFIFSNLTDYHRPMIAKGLIIEDIFTDGLNKEYFIKILEIIESPKIINDFFIGKQFEICPIKDGGLISNRKIIQASNKFNFEQNLFKIESFFVRNTLEKIITLRQEYINIIRDDLTKQLNELNSI